MKYIRFNTGLTSYELIPDTENVQKLVEHNREQDYYTGIYKYNEEQYQQWKKNGTISGIKDVNTDRLVFDFDDIKNPENAKQDTLETISRLGQRGVPENAIQLAWSGSKGFSIEVEIDKTLTVNEFKTITHSIAGDLKTFDKVVCDPSRVFRIVGTKHNRSGLYKIPLSVNQLAELTIPAIRLLASSLDNIDQSIGEDWHRITLPDSILHLKDKKKEEAFTETEVGKLNIKDKPHWLTPAMYALQEGFFIESQRSNSLIILAARYRHQGFNKAIAYRMLKGVCETQALRNNVERFSDSDLYNTVVEVVYSPSWNGGQYAKDHPFLVDIAKGLGLDTKDEDTNTVIEISDIKKEFLDYAQNFEQNIVTTGIHELDRNVMFLTSTHNGLLGQPGSGKTSIAIQWLEHISSINSSALFYSLDMAKPIIYANMIKRVKALGFKEAMKLFKDGGRDANIIAEQVEQKFKNVKFSFKTGSSPASIKDDMKRHEDITQIKTKLLIIDYLECLAGPYTDSTANTGFISNQMKDLASEMGVCSVMLLQTQKHGGDISDPLESMKRIKGSSIIEQSASVVLTLWREGYNPSTISQDKFMSFAVVKNRFGPLWRGDFYFKGSTGYIWDIDDSGDKEIAELRAQKIQDRINKAKDDADGF